MIRKIDNLTEPNSGYGDHGHVETIQQRVLWPTDEPIGRRTYNEKDPKDHHGPDDLLLNVQTIVRLSHAFWDEILSTS